MNHGVSYSSAYDSAINTNVRLRDQMQKIIASHPPLIIHCSGEGYRCEGINDQRSPREAKLRVQKREHFFR